MYSNPSNMVSTAGRQRSGTAWSSAAMAWRSVHYTTTGIPACTFQTTIVTALLAMHVGDVIDFYANLFSLPLYEAAQRLASDFCINADRPSTQAVLEKRMQK